MTLKEKKRLGFLRSKDSDSLSEAETAELSDLEAKAREHDLDPDELAEEHAPKLSVTARASAMLRSRESLQTEIQELQGQLEAAEADLASANESIADLQAQVADLEEKAAQAEEFAAEINRLEADAKSAEERAAQLAMGSHTPVPVGQLPAADDSDRDHPPASKEELEKAMEGKAVAECLEIKRKFDAAQG